MNIIYIYIYIYIYIFHGYCIYLSGSSKKGFLYNVKKLLYIYYTYIDIQRHIHTYTYKYFFSTYNMEKIFIDFLTF